jgi:hypothetical protein
MELGLDSCQFRYFVDIIDTHPMTAPRIDLCMVGKARVAQSRAATRNYVFTVLPDRWTALQCNMSEQMKRPLEELHHCDCTILISR